VPMMSSDDGRALAEIPSRELSAKQLGARGWRVEIELEDVVISFRDFPSLDDAQASAAADLPRGTTVNWTTNDGQLSGGFIVGHDKVAPPVAGIVPAFVLWPDGSQQHADTIAQLVRLLRDRMDWLVDLALSAGFDPDKTAKGGAAAVRALDGLRAGGRLTIECCGPFYDLRCAAQVEPDGRLRWVGFSDGWNEPDGPPLRERRHPVQYVYDGDFSAGL
jgi:hypothetical protein